VKSAPASAPDPAAAGWCGQMEIRKHGGHSMEPIARVDEKIGHSVVFGPDHYGLVARFDGASLVVPTHHPPGRFDFAPRLFRDRVAIVVE